MTARLAKLAAIRQRLSMTDTAQDAFLLRLLLDASELAERLAGLEPGNLRYQPGRVEYPWDNTPSTTLFLQVRPLWSVSDIRVLEPGTVTISDAAYEAVDALVEGTDFLIRSQDASELVTRVQPWRHAPRMTRVTYTGGYIDPARVDLSLTTATYTAATRTLTQAGAFENYTFANGDVVVITGGTGATPGCYRIASRVSDDAITLADEGEPLASVDLSAGDITDALTGARRMVPGDELQGAIENQVIQFFQSRDNAGIRDISFGQGGSVSTVEAKPHKALQAWAERFKRRFFN